MDSCICRNDGAEITQNKGLNLHLRFLPGVIRMAATAQTSVRKVVAENRKARFSYFIDDTFEAGIALAGSEVKSLRQGKANIQDSYATGQGGEIYLINAYIPEYLQANRFQHETRLPQAALAQARGEQADWGCSTGGDDARSPAYLFQRQRPGQA